MHSYPNLLLPTPWAAFLEVKSDGQSHREFFSFFQKKCSGYKSYLLWKKIIEGKRIVFEVGSLGSRLGEMRDIQRDYSGFLEHEQNWH